MDMHRLACLLLVCLAVACRSATAPTQGPTGAASRLEGTPRHHEWIDVARGERVVRTYVVYPERKDRAPAVVVIHENRGLTDWVRAVADRLAEEGRVALAPDLLSGMAEGGGGTREFASEDAAREAIGRLPAAQVRDDLRAVIDRARGLAAANGRVAVAGFCWGGAQAWRVASDVDGLAAVFVFYGTGPEDEAGVAGIDAPVYGFYGGNDARVSATLPGTEARMREAGKRFEPVIYDGAGHAFMREGERPDASPANRTAMEAGWKRWLELLPR